jgi:hypothetical protein
VKLQNCPFALAAQLQVLPKPKSARKNEYGADKMIAA